MAAVSLSSDKEPLVRLGAVCSCEGLQLVWDAWAQGVGAGIQAHSLAR